MPTYGLKVLNNSNQVIIDSDEGYPHFTEVDSTTINGGTDNEVTYPTDFEFNKLVFARPTSTCRIMEAGNTGGDRGFWRSSASAVVQLLKADVTSGNVSNHDNGYGLNIFDGTGAASASTLVFSTNVGSSLDIKAIGSYNSIAPNHTITYDAGNSTEPHYVLLPGSFRYYWSETYGGDFGGSSITQETNRGYKFNYSGNQLQSIDIMNKFIHNGTPAALFYGGGAYMIVKRRS